MTLNCVPIKALSIFGTIAEFEVAPAAATMTSRERAVGDGLDRARVPGGANVLQLTDAAEPVELQGVVMRAGIAEQRIHGGAVGEGADHRTVALGAVVERRSRPQARPPPACSLRIMFGWPGM